MAKFLTNIKIDFISLVRKGANKRTVIFKSAEGEPGDELRQMQAVVKDDAKQMIYGIVYAPDEEDAHGHQATAQEIERAAYGFMKALKAQNVDKQHSFKVDGGAYVAESWIVREGDPLFKSEPEGAWAVGIKCEDAALYEEAKTELPAISMAGTATIVSKSADEQPQESMRLLRKIWSYITKQEQPMEEQEMDEKKINELISAAIAKSAEGKPAPITEEQIAKTVAEVAAEALKPVIERLEKLEKQTPGTRQDESDTAELLKAQTEAGERIAKMAMKHIRKEG